jgi:hypothetical protein
MTSSDKYQPKVGDRVRVTIDAPVGVVDPSSSDPGAFRVDLTEQDYIWILPATAGVGVEKLPDAEPVWVEGDLISVDGTSRLVRGWDLASAAPAWRNIFGEVCGDGHVSDVWRESRVTVLYKADAS